MKSKYTLGTILIVCLMFFAGVNLGKYATPYVSIEEAIELDYSVQVKGARVEGSAQYNSENEMFEFQLSDGEGRVIQVKYPEPKPSNFDRASEVVAVGVYRDGAFWADRILIKCPSKYEVEGPIATAGRAEVSSGASSDLPASSVAAD